MFSHLNIRPFILFKCLFFIVEFDEYFLNLTLKNNQRNLWFSEYWQEVGNCTLGSIFRQNCTKQQRALTRGYEQEGLVQFVIDSVYALAHALHNYLKNTCKTKMKDCSLLKSPDRQELLEYIRNVSFTGKYYVLLYFILYDEINTESRNNRE